jgi:hypothetical protein
MDIMNNASTLSSSTLDVSALLEAILREMRRFDRTATTALNVDESPDQFTVKVTGIDSAVTQEVTGSGFILDKNPQADGTTEYVVATAAHVADAIQQKGLITTSDGVAHSITNIVKPKANADGTVTDVAFISFKVNQGGAVYAPVQLTTADVGDKIVIAGFPEDTSSSYTESKGSIVDTNEPSISKEKYTGQTVISQVAVSSGDSGSASYESIGGTWYANGLTSLRVQTKSGGEFAGSVSTTDIATLYKDLTGDTSVTVKTSQEIAAAAQTNSSFIALTTMMSDPQFNAPDAQVSSVYTNAMVDSIYAAIVAANPA